MVAPPASRASDEEISVAAACSVLERLEPGRLDERALDDVWADPELLAIEFESIVSANYPTSADRADRRPPPERCPVTTSRTPIPHQVDRRSRTPAPARRRPARRLAVARERGPPATTTAPRPTATGKEVIIGRHRPDPSLLCRERATADVRSATCTSFLR